MSPRAHVDPCLDPASGVLRNRFGITDAAELERVECTFCAVRAYALECLSEGPPLTFDLTHLCALHRTLFGDVYPWAGELRQVDISRGNTLFAHAELLESAAHKLFGELAHEWHLRGLDAAGFSQRAGYYLGEINVLHPFREGNGRTQRVFLDLLAAEAGYRIAWERIPREEMLQATIEAYESGSAHLAALIRQNLLDRHADQDSQPA